DRIHGSDLDGLIGIDPGNHAAQQLRGRFNFSLGPNHDVGRSGCCVTVRNINFRMNLLLKSKTANITRDPNNGEPRNFNVWPAELQPSPDWILAGKVTARQLIVDDCNRY